MTRNCPKCGKQVPDDAKFCMDCGYAFDSNENTSKFSLSTLFIILIAAVLIIGGIFILTSGSNNDAQSKEVVDDVAHVDLTISEVNGWDSDDSDSKTSYTLYTEAIFNNVPDDLKGYNVKTRYFDSNDTEIGHETEKLENVYYDTNYPIMFGYYTTYKLPDADHVTVEIIKSGKVVDSYTENIDKNKIDYLN